MFKKHYFLKYILLISLLLGLSFVVYRGYQSYEQKKWSDDMTMNAIFTLKEESVTKWELHYDGNNIVVERGKGNDAYLTEPVKEPIDYDNYLAEVKNFNSISTYSEVDQGKDHLDKWGVDLEKNYYRVYYTDGNKIRTQTIYRGKKLEFTDGYYLYHKESDKVYAAKFWVVAALEKTLPELRARLVWEIETEAMQKILRPDFTAVRSESGWSIEGIEKKDLESFNFGLLISRLAHIRVDAVYEPDEMKIDFEKSEDVALVYLKNKKKAELKISLIQKDRRIYMKMSSDDKVYLLDRVYYENFVKPKSFYIKQKS